MRHAQVALLNRSTPFIHAFLTHISPLHVAGNKNTTDGNLNISSHTYRHHATHHTENANMYCLINNAY